MINGIFSGKLLVSDLDNTLLNDKHVVSSKNIEAIEYFVKNGGKFTIATGRSIYGVSKIAAQLPIDSPIILNNGAQIYDVKNNCDIWNKGLSEGINEVIEKILNNYSEVGVEVFTNKGIYVLQHNELTIEHGKREELMPGIYNLKDVPKVKFKILVAGERSTLVKVNEMLKDNNLNIKTVFSEKYFMDIIHDENSKGNSLMALSSMLGYDMENITTVGDNFNDIEMLKVAGTGIAVNNAENEVKKVADYITVKNTEHAMVDVVNYIENGITNIDIAL